MSNDTFILIYFRESVITMIQRVDWNFEGEVKRREVFHVEGFLRKRRRGTEKFRGISVKWEW